MWLGRSFMEPTFIERLDAMFAAGECPDAVIVFVDAWTSRGGSQFLNSTGTGPLPGLPRATRWCRSSTSAIRRSPTATTAGSPASPRAGTARWSCRCCAPTCSAALASHAGDALFECAYQPDFPAVARAAARHVRGLLGGLSRAARRAAGVRLRQVRQAAGDLRLRVRVLAGPRSSRARRCCRSRSTPAGCARTSGSSGWSWTRFGWRPRHADALRSMRRIYLDAGRSDEWYLDLGAQAFANELSATGHRALAGAVRRPPRRHRLPLSGRHPRARSSSALMAVDLDQELAFAGPAALAALVRNGEVTPRELVELFLARIEALDPRLNAFRTTLAEQALAEADARDRDRRPAGRRPDRGQGRHRRRRPGRGPAARARRRRRRPPTPRRCAGCAPPARSRSGSPTSPS